MIKKEAQLREVGKLLEAILPEIYGCEMGFILLVSPQNTSSAIADFISNSRREDSIAWMKETIERFKANEVIPETRGRA